MFNDNEMILVYLLLNVCMIVDFIINKRTEHIKIKCINIKLIDLGMKQCPRCKSQMTKSHS